MIHLNLYENEIWNFVSNVKYCWIGEHFFYWDWYLMFIIVYILSLDSESLVAIQTIAYSTTPRLPIWKLHYNSTAYAQIIFIVCTILLQNIWNIIPKVNIVVLFPVEDNNPESESPSFIHNWKVTNEAECVIITRLGPTALDCSLEQGCHKSNITNRWCYMVNFPLQLGDSDCEYYCTVCKYCESV